MKKSHLVNILAPLTMQDWMFQQEGFGLCLIAPLLILGLPTQIADQTETKHPSKSMKNTKRQFKRKPGKNG